MGGETMRLGRKTPKGVTGYDLTALFVGSEGTFGVTSEITVRLIGKPEGVGTFIAVMPDAVSAGRAVSAIIRKGYRPRALELLDRAAIEHVRPKAAFSFPAEAGAIVLVELDGEPDGMEAGVLRCGAVCEEEGAREVIVARDDADRERLWQTRRLVSRSLREAHAFKISEDIVVPPGSIAEMLRRCDAIGGRQRLLMATFGHAGDGNLHVNVLTDENHREPAVSEAHRRRAGRDLPRRPRSRRHALRRARHRHRQGQVHGLGAVARGDRLAEAHQAPLGSRRSCSTPARSSAAEGTESRRHFTSTLSSSLRRSIFDWHCDLMLARIAGLSSCSDSSRIPA